MAVVRSYPYYDPASEANFDLLVSAIQQRGGCALIGAGLSQQAGLPGWEVLVGRLRAIAGLAPVRFSPLSAPREMEAVRDSLGDRYMDALREAFDLAGRELPESYRRLSNVRFGQLATTNVDELLHVVATVIRGDDGSEVYVHGSDDLVGKRYFYLHGRLKTALRPDEVVLCSRDYALAYGPGGRSSHGAGGAGSGTRSIGIHRLFYGRC